ncbi:hypothetical protein SPFL3102_01068 [Sporomusaceae bacterium FL31]|nr:hypothetical protein SPFL3101_00323 [Sporomusaceae bacterium FL31]GCE33264.1 hypothetical protein SPFL3102_01068 [Sporomusaceae bacterium]
MQKIRDLLGLPVLETKNGTQIGEVQEVIVDIDQASVRGIIIANANWFTSEQGIAFNNLHSIGRDAVMVRDAEVIQGVSEFISSDSKVYRLNELLDKHIFTESGLQLGALVDLGFESVTGEIKAYHVSDGVLTDLLYGRMSLPLPQAQIVGQDKVIVPESMAKLLHTETELS